MKHGQSLNVNKGEKRTSKPLGDLSNSVLILSLCHTHDLDWCYLSGLKVPSVSESIILCGKEVAKAANAYLCMLLALLHRPFPAKCKSEGVYL